MRISKRVKRNFMRIANMFLCFIILLPLFDGVLVSAKDLMTSQPASTTEEVPLNGTIMQYFEWYLPDDGQHWDRLGADAEHLNEVGITSVWIPPAYKGHVGTSDVGYGVYDFYDLGEFNQKGTVRTKYGTKEQLQNAVEQLHAQDVQVYADIVVNHLMGADASESVRAVEVNPHNRNQDISGEFNHTAWTVYNYDGRNNAHSSFKWRAEHFDGVDDWGKIYRFANKKWDWEASTENGNYDYLMGTDLDFNHPDVAQEIKNWGVWYTEEIGLDGFRLDAVKHIKYEFMRDFVNYVRAETGKEMFTVGEFIGGQGDLQRYLDVVDHNMSLFDFPLRNNFAEASSSNGNFDMRQLSNNTLVGSNPMHAVTFIENHDTQPDRDDAHGAPVLDWFKPLAYAYILTREEGYPKVFYGDYYGTNGTNGNDIAPLRDQLDPLLLARKNNAYGTQHDYLDDADLIGWTREGHPSKPGSGLATVMTNRSGGTKNMYVGTQHAGSTWIDTTGNIKSSVTIDSSGYGNFSVKDGSVSVWVPEYDGSQHDELPTTPENLRATTSDSAVELEWNASNDDNGVTNYEVYRNNKLIAEPINPHYIDQGVQSNTTYNYRVRAVDTAGQRSGFSSTVTVKTSDSDDDDDDDDDPIDIPDPTELVNKPFSWDNANVYFVLTDRFYNGNTSNDNSYGRPQQDAWGKNIGTFHGGDIKGLTKKLEEGYFTELGTNAIWITAPWEQIHGWVGGGSGGDFAHYAYHGYYGLDFTAMDQNMGTIDEMREFVDLAHSLGIRVVLDIVMNHVGYPTIVDMHDFGFGDSGGLSRNWTPDRGQGQDWHTHNNVINKDNAAAWANWWGRDWIRADETAGYDNGGSSEISMNLSFLPDVKTETTTGVSLPPILKNKWNDQSSGSEDWLVPAAEPYRQELNIAPKDYMVKWITSWVEEFGIDGFRVDTAKHVEIDRWAQLKDEAEVALQTWRENNPDRPGANWDDDFWMTAEVFGHGLGKSEYFDHGFDSVINFDFQNANKNDLEGLFSRYAKEINNDPDYNVLSYISSHDTDLYNRSDLIQAGTALLLLPGGVQTFYGDETARPMGDGGSDREQGTRSSMNWENINQTVLSHWQKLGQFRNDHIAVGAGEHQQLASSPYTFSRVYESDELIDEVVIAVGAQGTTAVTVEGIFEDGTVVRDAYTGNETTVTNGTASFAAGNQGIILIENTAPVTNLPVVSASPGSSSFRTDEITIALNLDRAESGKYTLDGSNPEDGIAFTDGEELTIGADMEFDEVVTLRLYAENENGTKTRSYTYRKLDPDAVLKVYFQKPADWGTPQIYYYDTLPEETEVTWNTAPTMTQVKGDWYVYIFENAQSANIIFKDASGRQNPGPDEPGFLVENVGWYDGQKWLDSDPFERDPKDPATTPENLRGIAVTETTVTLKWDRSDGHVVEYEVLRDGDVVGTTTQTTYTDQNLNPDTTYTYSVVAVGDEEQRSTPSEVVEVTTNQEDKEPAETPENLRLADVTESTVTINWNVSNGYVTGYEILRDGVVVGETSETTFTDNGLDPATTYTYAVVALGDADQKSEASEELEVTTQEELEGNYVTVYYKHGFDTPHMHYRPQDGEWTTAPGVRMEESEIAGYSKLSVDIGEAAKLEVAFNNGRGAWDSDNENNYLFEPGIHTYVPSHHGRGDIIPGKPDLPVEGNKVTIYYQNGFDTPHVHYRPEGGNWTDAPGLPMEDSEYAGYSKLTIDIGEASRAEVAFNNGRGAWDSDNENNYFFEIGDNTYIPGHNGSPGDVNQGKPTPPGEGNKVTIYYERGFDTPHVHYRPEGGTWTNAPGIKMEESEVAGYSKVTLDIGRATRAEVAFNDGRGAWDSDNENNYFFEIGDNTYIPGHNGSPGDVNQGKPTPPGEGNKVTIYYERGFDTPYVHYRPEGGTWTNAPGIKMEESEVAGYSKVTLDIGRATRAEVAFNDGRGAWDSDNENNYFFEIGDNTYIPGHNGSRGDVYQGKPTPPGEGNKVTIYYERGFDTPYVHYRPEGGTWTNAPGLAMEDSEFAGYSEITLDIGNATRVEVAFNNGRGAWDSDNERNYFFVVGNNTYEPGINGAPGQVKQGELPYGEEDPGDNKEPEQSPPSRPTDLTATATASTVSLSWTASTDNVEVAGYRVYRDGKEVGVTDTTTYTDTGLRAETSYIYEVQAYDTSDNSSALSDELIIETAEEAVVEPGGNMPYSTNPSFGKRVSTPITIDGVNDGEWTDDMLIAIGMAGDDPRTLGENWSVHETPMDLSHLWAAWDHEYLYLAWQYVDVTDVIDPANAGSSAGTPISSMDMLQTIAIDTIPGQGASLDMWGKNGGETLWGGPDLPDYQLNLASNLWHSGYISRAVDGVFPVDDEGVDYSTGKDAGIEAAFSAGKGYNELWGVFDADHANDPSELVEFLELGHDPTRDTFYEVKIPLSAIGNPDIENQGLGVMIHQGEFSAMDTLPNDPASSDTIGVSESNSPLEWQDIDLFTAPFARIGQ